MNSCKWTAEGHLNQAPEICSNRGRKHAIVRLGMDDGEIVIFAHEESLLGDVRKLKTGDKVRFTGIIEPRNAETRSTKPYFLNPVFFEKLN